MNGEDAWACSLRVETRSALQAVGGCSFAYSTGTWACEILRETVAFVAIVVVVVVIVVVSGGGGGGRGGGCRCCVVVAADAVPRLCGVFNSQLMAPCKVKLSR